MGLRIRWVDGYKSLVVGDCFIHPTIDRSGEKLIVISAIDNLVKGAAGQAIQNMNLMLGLPEVTGLEALAVYP